MYPFTFYNPTKLIFGEGKIADIAKEIPASARLMLTFGGGSAKKNGVYDQVVQALSGREYIEFWGIESNPTVETIRECVAKGKEYRANYILAVGGGSVIDATKLISAALVTDEDPWQLVLKGKATEALPFGAILTIPATGSEMNSGAVISRRETKEKYAFYSQFPVFSVLDPMVTFSLPETQLSYGIADAFVHVIEQYLTSPDQSRVMDRFAEGVLLTLIEIAPQIIGHPADYQLRADFMLSATMALNGFLALGVKQDWATHMIGHEITALTGFAHGASLVLVLPGLLRVLREQKGDKLLQYAERVWGIGEGSRDERIDQAINRTEAFFRSLGLATRLQEAHITPEMEQEIVHRFAQRDVKYGEGRNVDAELTRQILTACR